MQNSVKIDYSKLLGFDLVSDEMADGIDFQQRDRWSKARRESGYLLPKCRQLSTCLWKSEMPARRSCRVYREERLPAAPDVPNIL